MSDGSDKSSRSVLREKAGLVDFFTGNKNAVAVSCVFETATACPFCGYAGCSRVRKLSVHGDGVVVDNRVQSVLVADGCNQAVEDMDAAGSKCFKRSQEALCDTVFASHAADVNFLYGLGCDEVAELGGRLVVVEDGVFL